MRYELWLTNAEGDRIESPATVASIDYTAVLGDVGAAQVVLFGNGLFRNPRTDWRLEIWRRPTGGGLYLEWIGFVRDWEYATAGARELVILTAVDLNDLLQRKIVAYADGSTEANQTGTADDIMRELVRDNLGADATTNRQLSNFSVEPDTSDGTSITVAVAWQPLLPVLQDIQAASLADGDEVFFGIVPTTPTAFEFRARTGQWGADRTAGQPGALFFGTAFGNVGNVTYRVATSQEINRIYCLGAGVGEERILTGVGDDEREEASPYNRREGFVFGSSETAANLQDEGNRELERGRARSILAADILDTPQARYGSLDGWRLGDRITIDHAGLQLNAIIRTVSVSVDENGRETIQARAEGLTVNV